MFCPQCGQQQVTGVIRFCSRCGFPLDGVIQLLNNGGNLPMYRSPDEPVPVSPRKKGVKQGGLLLLSGAVLVPILGIFSSYSDSRFLEILTALAAIICFMGGPLRMLFAAVNSISVLSSFAIMKKKEFGVWLFDFPPIVWII